MTCAELVARAKKVATPRHNPAEFDLCKLVKAAGRIPVAVMSDLLDRWKPNSAS